MFFEVAVLGSNCGQISRHFPSVWRSFLVAFQNLDFCGLRTELLSADQEFSSQPSGDVGLQDLSGIA